MKKHLKRLALALLLLLLLGTAALVLLPIPLAWAINKFAPAAPLSTRVENATFRYKLGEDSLEITLANTTLAHPETRQAAVEISGIKIRVNKTALWQKRLLPQVEIASIALNSDTLLQIETAPDDPEDKLPSPVEILAQLQQNFRDSGDGASLRIAGITLAADKLPSLKIANLVATVTRTQNTLNVGASLDDARNNPAAPAFQFSADTEFSTNTTRVAANLAPLEIPAELLKKLAPEHADKLPPQIEKIVTGFDAELALDLETLALASANITARLASDSPEKNPALRAELIARTGETPDTLVLEKCEFQLDRLRAAANNFKIATGRQAAAAGQLELQNLSLAELLPWIPENVRAEIQKQNLPPVEIAAATANISATHNETDTRLKIPSANLALLDGPDFALSNATLSRRQVAAEKSEISAVAEFAAHNINAALAQPFAPPEILEELEKFGLVPADFFFPQSSGQVTASATFGNGKIADEQVAVTLESSVEIPKETLSFTLDFRMPGKGGTPVLKFAATPVNLSRLKIKIPDDFALPEGVDLAAFDISVAANAEILLNPDLTPKTIGATFLGKDGALLPTPFYDARVPVKNFLLQVVADGAFQQVAVAEMRVDFDGPEIFAEDIAIDFSKKPHPVSGKLRAEKISVPNAYRFWPGTLFSDERALVVKTFQAGALTRATFEFSAKIDPEKPETTRPEKLVVRLNFEELRALAPEVEKQVTLGQLAVAVDWPRAKISAKNLNAPALQIPFAQIAVEKLDQAEPQVFTGGSLSVDLSKIGEWLRALNIATAPDAPVDLEKLRGQTAVNWSAMMPLKNLEPDITRAKATLDANLTQLEVPWINPQWKTGGGSLSLNAKLENNRAEISANVDGLFAHIPDAVEGKIALSAVFGGNLSEDKFGGNLSLDLGGARLLVHNAGKLPPLAVVSAVAEVSGVQKSRQVAVALSAASPSALGLPLDLRVSAEIAKESLLPAGPVRLEARLGESDFLVETVPAKGEIPDIVLRSRSLNLPELLRWSNPIVAAIPEAAPSSSGQVAAAAASPVDISAPWKDARLSFELGKIDLGEGRGMRDARGEAVADGHVWRHLRMSAFEGANNAVSLELRQRQGAARAEVYDARLEVADSFAWVGAVAFPVSLAPVLSAKEREELSGELRVLARMFRGGRLEMEGVFQPTNTAELFEGRARFKKLLMVESPLFLRLLALKTKRTLQANPLLETVDMDVVFLRHPLAGAEKVVIDGAGLLNLSLAKASLNLENEKISILGKYFGIPFEIAGTRDKPEIYLQETKALKMITNESDLFFGFEEEAPKKK